MTNEDLRRIMSGLEIAKEERQEIKQLLEEIEKYEQIPEVKKYLELVSRCDSIDLSSDKDIETISKQTDEDLVKDMIKNQSVYFDGNDTNGIYVYMGTFRKKIGSIDWNDPKAEYRIYRNLELLFNHRGYEIKVPISDCENFESENIVVYPEENVKSHTYYDNLQAEFLLTAINESQEKAVAKVLTKRKNKSN